jgi:ABC-type uncharacterized transport system substrate-binding protein
MRLLKILSISVLSILTLSLTPTKESKNMVTIKKHRTIRILSVFFPTDSGLWTDKIISSFTSTLQSTGLSLDFTTVSYTAPQDPEHTIKKIKEQKADVIFLPDDGLFKLFGKRLREETNAHIAAVTFYTKKTDIPANDKRLSTVFCDPPVDHLLKRLQEIAPVKSISVVGGPFSKGITERIKEKIGSKINLKITLTKNWDVYTQTVKEGAHKFDAVWPLATCGVELSDGAWVADHQYKALLTSLDSVVLGYVSGFDHAPATISMNIDPSELGSNAADIVFKHLRGESPGVKDFTSYSLHISKQSILKLNLKLPEKLLGFLVY